MNAGSKTGRRRALDHLPWGSQAKRPAGPSPRAIEFYRGGKDDYTSFPYTQLIWVNYFKSYGIVVHFGSHTVHILGQALEAVYQGIRDQTLDSVGPEEEEAPSSKAGVEKIFIKQVGQNATGFLRPTESDLKRDDA